MRWGWRDEDGNWRDDTVPDVWPVRIRTVLEGGRPLRIAETDPDKPLPKVRLWTFVPPRVRLNPVSDCDFGQEDE